MERLAYSIDVTDDLPFGVGVFDAEGRCLRSNRALCALASGITPTGNTVDAVMASCFGVECAVQAREDFDAVLRDGRPRTSREWRERDGVRRYDCAWQPCAKGDAAAVVSVIDVTTQYERREVLEERAKLAASLTAVETTLAYTTDFDEILSALVAETPDGFECTAAAVLAASDEGWFVRHVRGLPRPLVGRVFRAGEVPGFEEALQHRRPAGGRITGAAPVWGDGEAMAVPLTATGTVAAVLVLLGRRAPFSHAALDCADKLSTVASFALENARLQETERETREMLQTALLGVVREIPGVRFGHLYRSATRRARVGGDFYELLVIDDGHVGVLMGDVSGNGLEAASLAALVKTTVKIHALDLGSPAAVLAKANHVLLGECDSYSFVTAFYGVFDTVTGELTYCSAGHPPALLRRAEGETAALREGSPILGAYADLEYVDRATCLTNGDTLLLYTDGLTEARREREQFGEQRLISLVDRLGDVDPRDLPELVFEEVFSHACGDLHDDMAILALSPTAVGRDRPQQRLPL